MKVLKGLALSAAALCVAGPLAAQSAAAPAQLVEARAAFKSAMEAFDAAAAGTWFADSAVVDFGGDIIPGKRAITESWLPGVFADLASIALGNATWAKQGEDMLETSSHVVGTPDGPQSGTHTVHWRRTGQNWRIIRLVVLPGG